MLIRLVPRPTEGGAHRARHQPGQGPLGFRSVTGLSPAHGTPASASAARANVSPTPSLLLVGPENRLSLKAMLTGAFAVQERVGHLSGYPQGGILRLQTQVLASVSASALGFL